MFKCNVLQPDVIRAVQFKNKIVNVAAVVVCCCCVVRVRAQLLVAGLRVLCDLGFLHHLHEHIELDDGEHDLDEHAVIAIRVSDAALLQNPVECPHVRAVLHVPGTGQPAVSDSTNSV